LTKALQGAYINDGLSSDLAIKYSTAQAVKAMIKNCAIDKVKLVMQAGTFNKMNDAIFKFVNSCTEATGQPNTVLYCQNHSHHGGNRGRGNFRSRPFNRGGFRYNNNNGNRYNNSRGNPRGNSYRGAPNRGRG